MEFDGIALADELFRAYLQQIVVEGFSHGDPHPGNVFLMDNYCIALIDLGMVTMAQSWMQLAERVGAHEHGPGSGASSRRQRRRRSHSP